MSKTIKAITREMMSKALKNVAQSSVSDLSATRILRKFYGQGKENGSFINKPAKAINAVLFEM